MTRFSQRIAILGSLTLVILGTIAILSEERTLQGAGVILMLTAISMLYWVVPRRYGGRGRS